MVWSSANSIGNKAAKSPRPIQTQSHCHHKGCWLPRQLHNNFTELETLVGSLKTTAGRLHTLTPSELFGCQQKWTSVTASTAQKVTDTHDLVAAEIQGMMNERQSLMYSLECADRTSLEAETLRVAMATHQQHIFRSLTSLVTLLGAHRGYVLLSNDGGHTFTLAASVIRPRVLPVRETNRFGTELGDGGEVRKRQSSLSASREVHPSVPEEVEAVELLPADLFECCEKVALNGLALNVRMPHTQGSSLDTACIAPLRHPDHPLALGVIAIVDKLPTTVVNQVGKTTLEESKVVQTTTGAAQAAQAAMRELSGGFTGNSRAPPFQDTNIFTPADEARVCVAAELLSEYVYHSGLESKFCSQDDPSVFQSARGLYQTWSRNLDVQRCEPEGVLPVTATVSAVDINNNALPRARRDRRRTIPLRRSAHHFVSRIHTQPKIGSVYHEESNTVVRHPVRPVEVLVDVIETLREVKSDAKAMDARLSESVGREALAQENIRTLVQRLSEAKKEAALERAASQRLMAQLFLQERHHASDGDFGGGSPVDILEQVGLGDSPPPPSAGGIVPNGDPPGGRAISRRLSDHDVLKPGSPRKRPDTVGASSSALPTSRSSLFIPKAPGGGTANRPPSRQPSTASPRFGVAAKPTSEHWNPRAIQHVVV